MHLKETGEQVSCDLMRSSSGHRSIARVLLLSDRVSGSGKCRSRALFQTTKADEKAMAAPAMSGLRSPQAASGIAATL